MSNPPRRWRRSPHRRPWRRRAIQPVIADPGARRSRHGYRCGHRAGERVDPEGKKLSYAVKSGPARARCHSTRRRVHSPTPRRPHSACWPGCPAVGDREEFTVTVSNGKTKVDTVISVPVTRHRSRSWAARRFGIATHHRQKRQRMYSFRSSLKPRFNRPCAFSPASDDNCAHAVPTSIAPRAHPPPNFCQTHDEHPP